MKKILFNYQKMFLTFLSFFFVVNAFSQFTIIPKPTQLTPLKGQFEVYENTHFYVPKNQAEVKAIAQLLVNQLNLVNDSKFVVQELKTGANTQNAIIFSLKKLTGKNSNDESYHLKVVKNTIEISATKPQGLFYGLQTLLQLFPPQIYSSTKIDNVKFIIPACDIIDSPRYGYRGMNLDVCRHFFPVSFIKKYIDLAAMHKINQFHWHLTDDQGWRIEIKKYPLLTEIGSKRKQTMAGHYSENRYDNTPYGGFYTQNDIKEVIAYAKTKYINVIPEIEMPGHALAALTAYPELGCSGGPYDVGQKWGVEDDVFCPTEKTFSFLEDVLSEVIALFPSAYVHIGGDECPKNSWKNSKFCQDLMKEKGLKNEHELQSYFIKRIDKFVTSKGKKMIGWDEILEGGLSPNATVMSWRGVEGGIEAAKQHHDVIMTPTTYCYLDYAQGDGTQDSLAIGGFLPLEKVYSYDPEPSELTATEAKHILGTQANLWTEYVTTPQKVEYMIFPRACAIAEIAWSSKESKNYADFTNRLKIHQERLNYLNVSYYPKALYNLTAKTSFAKTVPLTISLENSAGNDGSVIRYSNDDKPTAQSPIYTKPFTLKTGFLSLQAATFSKDGQQIGNILSKSYFVNKATGKKYTLKYPSKNAINGGQDGDLTNGVRGEENKMDSWVFFEGNDVDVTVDLGEITDISRVSTVFMRNSGKRVFLPTEVEVSISSDGKTFESVQKIELDASMNTENIVQNVGIGTGKVKARYVRLFAKNYGKLPENHPRKGNAAWLALDEIVVE